MSREKQIEEMAKCCIYHKDGMCVIDKDISYCDLMCKMFGFITNLYTAGYRKQSENTVELPCRVGDTVYCIEHKTIRECIVKMVKSLTYDENETKYFVEAECEIESPFYSDGRKIKHGLSAVWEIEWGSWYRAFHTREEAEEALAKMKAVRNDK